MSSKRTEAHRRGGRDGEVVPVAGVPEGDEEAVGKLLRGDVVLLVPLAGAEGICRGESTVRPSGSGAGACRRCGGQCSGAGE
jgi:hypothetical protein